MIENSSKKVEDCFDSDYFFLNNSENLITIIKTITKTQNGIIPIRNKNISYKYITWEHVLNYIKETGFNNDAKADDIPGNEIEFIDVYAGVDEAMLLMMEKHAKLLVVKKDNIEKGVLTFEDLIFEVQNELSVYFENLKSIAEKRNQEIDQFLKLKEEYLTIAAHDLKSPVSIIQGFAKLLSEEKNLSNEQILSVNYIKDQCDTMLEMINDLLTSASIEAGTLILKKKSVDVNKFLKNIFDGFALFAKKKKINFLLENPNDLIHSFDESKIRECIINLLDNAFKNTNDGNINLGVDKKNNEISFFISDTGNGFDRQQVELLFKKYSTKNTTQANSIGLGLYITKKIVELHNGKINVTSEPGKGSTFEIVLP